MFMEKTGMKSVSLMMAGLLLFFFLGHYVRHTFSALLTALVLAYLLNPIMKYLQNAGFDRATALILLYGIGLFSFFLASFIVIPYVGHQMDSMTTSFPRYVQNVQQALDEWKDELPPAYAGSEGGWLLSQAEDVLGQGAREFSGFGYEHVKGVLFAIFDLTLAPILVFFLLYYKQFFKDNLKRLMPVTERRRLIYLGKSINSALERFLLASILDCLLVGILTSFALYLMKIEFPLLNGMFAGFASFVPFLGIAVAMIPAAFIGYAKSGDLTIIPKICLIYFIINVILEGNIIKPLIMRQTLKLNPLMIIFSVMAMGELLGFWGIILAVPLTALVKICMIEVRDTFFGDQQA